MERYYTVSEIASSIQTNRRTVINWIRGGHLIAVKLAGRRFWRVREKDLRRFLKVK
jgi:excisionase family DNA binding protein